MSMGLVKSAYIKEIFGGNKMFKKLKDKKGFTLVELIVVLVILAILAALLIPALTGYIDKANYEKVIASTRQVVMAAQTDTSEAYASIEGGKFTVLTLSKDSTPKLGDVVELAELGTAADDGKITYKNGISAVTVTITENGHVSQVTVTQNGFKCTYDENTSTVTKPLYKSGNYAVEKVAAAAGTGE